MPRRSGLESRSMKKLREGAAEGGLGFGEIGGPGNRDFDDALSEAAIALPGCAPAGGVRFAHVADGLERGVFADAKEDEDGTAAGAEVVGFEKKRPAVCFDLRHRKFLRHGPA